MADDMERVTRPEPENAPPVRWTESSPAESVGQVWEPLVPESELDGLRTKWREIQGLFVDEPREAVEKADQLVDSVVKRVTETFAEQRANLESAWDQGRDMSTEDLRQSLRRYRSFFDRLLAA
jgi:hypothetical protein